MICNTCLHARATPKGLVCRRYGRVFLNGYAAQDFVKEVRCNGY